MSDELIPVPGVFGENGNFLIERELGRGGMGGVYMGRDKMLDRPVAVKVMLKELGADPSFVEKFKKEAQAAARLIHPNIAQVYSYGISDGMPYMVMELAAGGSLDRLMSNAPGETDVTRVFKIIQQVAKALSCAADQGLVHGDVKPENVLFDANGNAKLVDFGLAAMQSDTNEIWGTPYYIAPEKVRKEPVDFRADMYSLGGTFYHALTGVAPFEGDDANAVVKARFSGRPKKPSEIRAGLSRGVDNLVMKMLAREPKDRFSTFEQLNEEMNRVMSAGVFASAEEKASGGDEGGLKGGHRVKLTIKRSPKTGGTAAAEGPKISPVPMRMRDPGAEDERKDNVGLKVGLVVGGVLLGIGLIAGLLFWYVQSAKASRERDLQAQVDRGMREARAAVAQTHERVLEWAKTYDKYVVDSVKAIEEPTAALIATFRKEGKDYSARLRPPVPKELADLLVTTNASPDVAAAIAQVRKLVRLAPKTATNAVGVATNALAKATSKPKAGPKFRDPTDEEKDPNSPEGKDYLEAKAKWEAQQARASAAKKSAADEKPMPKPEATAAELRVAVDELLPEITKTIVELWNMAYVNEASYIRLRMGVDQIVRLCDNAGRIGGTSSRDAETVAKISMDAVAMFDSLRAGKDAENLRKVKLISSRARDLKEKTVKRIGQMRLDLQEKIRKAREAEQEKVRKEQEAKAHAELVAREIKAAAEKFDAVAAAGNFRQLNFSRAASSIKSLLIDFRTAEGELAVKTQLEKVEAMRLMHETIMSQMKGFVFQTGRFFHCKVTGVNQDEILLLSPDGKKLKVLWVKFYEQHRPNLNELINHFIVRGLKNNRNYALRRWSQEMIGAALIMRIVCSDAEGAREYSAKLVQEAVKKFPSIRKQVQDAFPDVKLETKAADDE